MLVPVHRCRDYRLVTACGCHTIGLHGFSDNGASPALASREGGVPRKPPFHVGDQAGPAQSLILVYKFPRANGVTG